MRILCCGSRDFTDIALVRRVLERFSGDVTMIHGGASGADTLAGEEAASLGVQIIPYPADWKQYGRAAGPIRNRQMLRDGKPDLVLAFCSRTHLADSRGTHDMVRLAIASGLHVEVFYSPSVPGLPIEP